MPNESVAVWAAGPDRPWKYHKPKYRIRTVISGDLVSTAYYVEVARFGLGGLLGWASDTYWSDRTEAVRRITALSSAGQVTMFNADGQEMP